MTPNLRWPASDGNLRVPLGRGGLQAPQTEAAKWAAEQRSAALCSGRIQGCWVGKEPAAFVHVTPSPLL